MPMFRNVFVLPELRDVVREEFALARAEAALLPAGAALLLQAPGGLPDEPAAGGFDGRYVVRLHGAADGHAGDLRCAACPLPFQSESFRLIVAQHLDAASRDAGAAQAAEWERLLMPGGLLLQFGFNASSPWAAWWLRQASRGYRLPVRAGAQASRRILLAQTFEPVELRRFGGLWPGSPTTAMRALQGVWMLRARKRREVLTPLPVRLPRQVVLQPRLAEGGSQRACG